VLARLASTPIRTALAWPHYTVRYGSS